MSEILEIEFKNRRTEYAANPMQFPFKPGDAVIIEVEKGIDLGFVSHLGFHPEFEGDQRPKMTALRKATPADLKILEQNHQREKRPKRTTRQKIKDHGLEMKLVDAELQWDGRKLTFYFTAEGRVDFRELVKELASAFRTRIDLRQIGARDETKKTGGYGVCGQSLCCTAFLSEFKPITTQMPRDQFLPLNPSKLSGVCGRLKCCLRYEVDTYREFQRQCPKVGHPVRDQHKGDGVVEKIDVVREEIQVRYSNGEIDKTNITEFQEISDWRAEMPRNEIINTISRKPSMPASARAVEVPEETYEPLPEEPGGERVTLLAGGGLGFTSTEGKGDIEVGKSIEVPQQAKKKKRRRNKHGKKTEGTEQQGARSEGSEEQAKPKMDSPVKVQQAERPSRDRIRQMLRIKGKDRNSIQGSRFPISPEM